MQDQQKEGRAEQGCSAGKAEQLVNPQENLKININILFFGFFLI